MMCVWSSATACFDVPDCDYVLDPDGSGQLIFGPKLMKKLKIIQFGIGMLATNDHHIKQLLNSLESKTLTKTF